MQAKPNSIYDLLSANKIYKIPQYQRQYSWQLPQCAVLWNDVKDIILQNINVHDSNGIHERTYHFLGTIVTVRVQNKKGGSSFGTTVGSVNLIDGQQRIVSMSLIVVALRQYVRNQMEQDPDNSDLKGLESTLTGLLERKSGNTKLELSGSDQEAYTHLIKDGSFIEFTKKGTKKNKTAKDSLLWENCRFFYKSLLELFDSKKGNIALTEQAIKPMFECLQFAHIELDPENNDNPQQVFESLNSSGLNLSQSDLIRNFLLMEMNVESQKALYHDYWCKLESNIENKAEDVQKMPELIQLFFAHFLKINNPDIKITEGDIYNIFKGWFNQNYNSSSNPNRDCLQELYAANQAWCYMYWSEGNSNSEIERTCFEIRLLDRKVLLPVMFRFIYDHYCGRISETTLLSCLKFFRSYSMRSCIKGGDVGNLVNSFVGPLLVRLKKVCDEERYESYLTTMLSYLCQKDTKDISDLKDTMKYVSDSEFRRCLINHNFIQQQQYVKTMLFITERYDNKEYALLPNEYSLDFILPYDTLSAVHLTEKKGWEKELIESYGNQEWSGRLGNLTLLAKKKPLPKITNDKSKWAYFANRRAELSKYYKRYINKELIDPNKSSWTVQDIKERGERLADLILEVFPYPDESLLKQ